MPQIFYHMMVGSFNGSPTEPGEDFEGTDTDPLEQIVGSHIHTSTSHIPSEHRLQKRIEHSRKSNKLNGATHECINKNNNRDA